MAADFVGAESTRKNFGNKVIHRKDAPLARPLPY
jgi:hypothetical protein